MKFFNLNLFFVLILVPQIIFAQIEITEIMYDIDGTDSGREWIEIYNSGTESVDISELILFENDVNHRIKYIDDNVELLEPDNYAVIADNPAKFSTDNPNFSGIVVDSAFSLNNSGEILSILDSENNVLHTVTYSPEWGAKGTGNTLQLNGTDWIPGKPTPGTKNVTEPENESENSDDNQNESSNSGNTDSTTNNNDSASTHSADTDLSNYKKKTELEISAGRKRYGFINSPIKFRSNHNLEEKSNVKFQWSFGDADSSKAENPKHTYYFPGEYNVVLNGEYQKEYAVSRTKVLIREPLLRSEITIRGKAVDILLINDSDFEVNLGEFFLVLDVNEDELERFEIAPDTIVDSKTKIKIPAEITDFILDKENPEGAQLEVFLRYPNGKLAAKYIHSAANSQNINPETLNVIRSFIDPDRVEELDLLMNNLLK